MTFLEALATCRPMRRKAHVVTDIPEWKWYVLHEQDHDWLACDDGRPDDRDDPDAERKEPETYWDGKTGFSRDDMLADDWEVLRYGERANI